jgi:hypothetical protein
MNDEWLTPNPCLRGEILSWQPNLLDKPFGEGRVEPTTPKSQIRNLKSEILFIGPFSFE